MKPITLTIPWDPNLLNPNRVMSLHWSEKMRRKNVAITAARLAWKQAGRPQMDGRVRVSATIRRGRGFDEDNAWGALKAVKDALFCGKRFEDDGGAITPDDSPRYVQLGEVCFECGKAWKGREEIVLTVELTPALAGEMGDEGR